MSIDVYIYTWYLTMNNWSVYTSNKAHAVKGQLMQLAFDSLACGTEVLLILSLYSVVWTASVRTLANCFNINLVTVIPSRVWYGQ